MEYEWAFSVEDKWEFNFSISTSHVGAGIYFTKGDFIDTLTVGLFVFHFVVMRVKEGWN